jgi:hypothetical protein
MRKIIIIVVAISALVVSGPPSVFARGHGHGHGYGYGHGSHVSVNGGIWLGPGWGAAWPGPFYPSYYPYYPYRYYAPRVVVEPRQEGYISQSPGPEGDDYWYYCRKPEGYYPYINKCPGGWMKVVPPPEAPQGEE